MSKEFVFEPCELTIRMTSYGISPLLTDKVISYEHMAIILDKSLQELKDRIRSMGITHLLEKEYLNMSDVLFLLDFHIREIKDPFDKKRINSNFFIEQSH